MAGRIHVVVQHRTAAAGIEARTLHTDHSFPRHAHDEFGIGVMLAGAQRSWSGIGPVESGPGDVITVNPGETHDGMPVGGEARAWRMLYLDPALVAREAAGWEADRPEIARPALRDAVLSDLFAALFAQVTEPIPDRLAVEEAQLRTLARLFRCHGARRAPPAGTCPAVDAARRRIEAAPELPVTLAELAALSGVSRFALLRGFRRELGMTPHAYLLQRRVRLARRSLTAGATPAEAALRAGFADQSHLTRAFRRQYGVTPGRWRAALA